MGGRFKRNNSFGGRGGGRGRGNGGRFGGRGRFGRRRFGRSAPMVLASSADRMEQNGEERDPQRVHRELEPLDDVAVIETIVDDEQTDVSANNKESNDEGKEEEKNLLRDDVFNENDILEEEIDGGRHDDDVIDGDDFDDWMDGDDFDDWIDGDDY